MAYEQKDMTASLFKNERKTTDQHPGMTGSALIDGIAYFVDSWTNVAGDGNKYLSLKFKRRDKQPGAAAAPAAKPAQPAAKVPFDDMDDQIPW
jgi:hypothetical protein